MPFHYSAVISGGTQGIGRYISRILTDLGWNVLALYKSNEEEAENFTKELGIKTLKCDITQDKDLAMLDYILSNNKSRAYVLVNNAGSNDDSSLSKMTNEQWDGVIDTVLKGTFKLTRTMLPYMKEGEYGSIINISSVVGHVGVFGTSNYSTAKAGLDGFTRTVAKEVAKYDINVNTIALGYFDTGIIKSVPAEHLKKIVNSIPMKRLGNYQDLSAIMYFITQTMFFTGQTVHLNGGLF